MTYVLRVWPVIYMLFPIIFVASSIAQVSCHPCAGGRNEEQRDEATGSGDSDGGGSAADDLQVQQSSSVLVLALALVSPPLLSPLT